MKNLKKGAFDINSIVTIMIVLVIVAALGLTINDGFTTMVNNTTGAAATLWGLGSLFFALIVIIGMYKKFSGRR